MTKETIDSQDIEGHTVDLSYMHGKGVPDNIMFVLIGVGIAGLLLLANGGLYGILPGLILIGIGALPWVSHYGVDICLKTGYIREYSANYGLKRGKWIPTKTLTDIAIMASNEGYTLNSRTFNSTTISERKVGVYFLSPNHRKKVLISFCDSTEEASVLAKELASKMEKAFVKFSPKISKSSLQRRR